MGSSCSTTRPTAASTWLLKRSRLGDLHAFNLMLSDGVHGRGRQGASQSPTAPFGVRHCDQRDLLAACPKCLPSARPTSLVHFDRNKPCVVWGAATESAVRSYFCRFL